MYSTEFVCLGIGYALSNKKPNAKDIEILLPHLSSNLDGERPPMADLAGVELTDRFGNISADSIITTDGIFANWLPARSGVMEPPSIRRGERVLVYHQRGTEAYWWTEMGLDDHLRRLDTILIAISNTRDESTNQLNYDNSYWIEFSTLNKRISITTTKSDGEPFMYHLALDTKEGELKFIDDIDNSIRLVSKERLIELKNADDSRMEIDKGVVTMSTDAGASSVIDNENITHTNAAGSVYSMIDDELTFTSPAGGSLVINKDVVAKSAGGSSVVLSTGATMSNGEGSMVALEGPLATTSASGGVSVVGNGMVMNN